jgi:hypothetical protein
MYREKKKENHLEDLRAFFDVSLKSEILTETGKAHRHDSGFSRSFLESNHKTQLQKHVLCALWGLSLHC